MPTATRRRRVEDSDEDDEANGSTSRQRHPSTSRPDPVDATEDLDRATADGPTSTTEGFDASAELRPQPLSRSQVPNLKSLMAELKSQDQNIIRCIELLNDTAEQTAEAFSTLDDCQELKQAELDLRELIDVQAERAIRRKVLEEITQDLEAGVEMVCMHSWAPN